MVRLPTGRLLCWLRILMALRGSLLANIFRWRCGPTERSGFGEGIIMAGSVWGVSVPATYLPQPTSLPLAISVWFALAPSKVTQWTLAGNSGYGGITAVSRMVVVAGHSPGSPLARSIVRRSKSISQTFCSWARVGPNCSVETRLPDISLQHFIRMDTCAIGVQFLTPTTMSLRQTRTIEHLKSPLRTSIGDIPIPCTAVRFIQLRIREESHPWLTLHHSSFHWTSSSGNGFRAQVRL